MCTKIHYLVLVQSYFQYLHGMEAMSALSLLFVASHISLLMQWCIYILCQMSSCVNGLNLFQLREFFFIIG